MRIKCINKGGASLLPCDLARGNTPSTEFHVTIGREYIVYGLLFFKNTIDYLMVDDTDLPTWHPASLFRVADGHIPQTWVFNSFVHENNYLGICSWPEIAQDLEFFDRLAVGDDQARMLFFSRRSFEDLQYEDSSIKEIARLLEGKWLQCPFCEEAWKSDSLNPMVMCPSCKRVSHNPYYQKSGEHTEHDLI